MTIVFSDFMFYIFSVLLLVSSAMVISVKNPVYAVLYLIFSFLNTAALFILIGAELVAMIIVIVHVGAVAILFLFVVMMLGSKEMLTKDRFVPYWPVSILLGGIFIVEVVFLLICTCEHPSHGLFYFPISADRVSNAHEIGEILYTDYCYIFQLTGVLLLIAMVSAIVLTLRYRPGVRHQKISKQIARSAGETVKLVKPVTGHGVDI